MAVELTETGRDNPAFLFALEYEAASFRKLCPHAQIHIIGVGAARASLNTQRIIEHHRPPTIILAGYGGALRTGLKVGDVVIANRIISSEPAAFARAPSLILPTDPSSLISGIVISSQSMVGEPTQKQSLHDQFGADVVDLESYAVAAVCDRLQVSWAVIRVISDDVNTRISPHVQKVIRAGKASIIAVLKSMLLHPSSVVEFMRLANDAALARRKLAQSLARAHRSAG